MKFFLFIAPYIVAAFLGHAVSMCWINRILINDIRYRLEKLEKKETAELGQQSLKNT